MSLDSDSLTAEERYRLATGSVYKALREQRHWSFRELAGHADIAHTSIYQVEQAKSTPTIDALDRVARAFGHDLPTMLGMILLEMQRDQNMEQDSLPELIRKLAELTPAQRAEAMNYIDFLHWKAGEPRTD
jgi:transcriptional regulator with XRE-family HTH domain